MTEPELDFCTIRDGGDGDIHLECRFKDGQKFPAVVVDDGFPKLAIRIAAFLNARSENFMADEEIINKVSGRWLMEIGDVLTSPHRKEEDGYSDAFPLIKDTVRRALEMKGAPLSNGRASVLFDSVIEKHIKENHDPRLGNYIVPDYYSRGVQEGIEAALQPRAPSTDDRATEEAYEHAIKRAQSCADHIKTSQGDDELHGLIRQLEKERQRWLTYAAALQSPAQHDKMKEALQRIRDFPRDDTSPELFYWNAVNVAKEALSESEK